MRVTVCVTINVPSTSFPKIEEACLSAGREAARQAIERTCSRMERSRSMRSRKARHGRPRKVLTRAGFVTLTRGRSRRPDGTRYFPLDERLGLPAHHEASPAVRARGVELACCHPYREAARLLSGEVGEIVDHRAVWRWVQQDGDEALRVRAEAVNGMFQDGEAPPRPQQRVPDHLTVAVDATGVRCTDGTIMSAKLAVAFTSSVPVGHSGKRSLLERHIYADICESDPFGMALAYELERRYGAHRIARLMLLGDGEPWIAGLGKDWLPTARYQLDHWHLAARVREFCRSQLQRYPRMLDRAFARPRRLAADLRAGRHSADPEEARLLASYLEHVAPYLYTFAQMGPGHWLHGSGPVEKHVELQINRRFKRRGMRWSRRGARHLLALRIEVIATA